MSKMAERLQRQGKQDTQESNNKEGQKAPAVTYLDEDPSIDIESIPYKYEWKTLTAGGKTYEDPRPDMPEDSFIWLQLFAAADEISPRFCQNLIYIRSPGSRMVKGKSGNYVIRSEIDNQGVHGWLNESQYKEYAKKWLEPYREELKALLTRLENLFAEETGQPGSRSHSNEASSQAALNI